MLQEFIPVDVVQQPTSAVDVIIQNIPTFLNTFLIFWNLRQSRRNAARLQKVETVVVQSNGPNGPSVQR